MGRPRVVYCKRCERHESVCGELSVEKLCARCGERAQLDNRRQLMAQDGPYYDHWRARLLAAFGVGIFAEQPAAAAEPAERLTPQHDARRVAP